MKVIYLIMCSFLFIIFSSCKKSDSNPVNPGTVNYSISLKIGNEWTYLATSFDSTGNVTQKDTVTFKIQGDTTIQNEKWYFIGIGNIAYELLTNRSDGLWYMMTNGSLKGIPYLFAKFPCQVNGTFLSIDSMSTKVLSINQNVSVPAGDYICYDFQVTDKYGSRYAEKYFPIGNLFVKDVFYYKSNSGLVYVDYKRELINNKLTKVSPGNIRTDSRFYLFNPF